MLPFLHNKNIKNIVSRARNYYFNFDYVHRLEIFFSKIDLSNKSHTMKYGIITLFYYPLLLKKKFYNSLHNKFYIIKFIAYFILLYIDYFNHLTNNILKI